MPIMQEEYFEPPAQRWIDGKRVLPSPVRSEFSGGGRTTRMTNNTARR